MKKMAMFWILLFGALGIAGCKVTGASTTTGACSSPGAGCEGTFGNKPYANILGKWISTNSSVVGPMTYYKTMDVGQSQVRFTQICARADGVAVTSTLLLDAQYIEEGIDLGTGGEREEYRYGISCRLQVDRGVWAYKYQPNTDSLELQNSSGSQILKFARTTN